MAATAEREPETKGHEVENDIFGHLEERIQKAVALVQRLRHENARLSQEVESLQTERLQVRTRLEKLLGHIDQLGPT